jgi:hypothetical protein
MKSWALVDHNIFANISDHMNINDANLLTDSLQRGQDTVDTTIPVNTSIACLNLTNFSHTIYNYCATLDAIYAFTDPIQAAIKAAADRIIATADRFRAPVATTATESLFSYLLKHFINRLNHAYRDVLGCTASNIIACTATFISAVASIPDTNPLSSFMFDVVALVARSHHAPTAKPVPSAKRQKVQTNTTTTPTTIPPICEYNLSKRQDRNTNKWIVGCTKSNCNKEHRAATTAADKAIMANFYVTYKNQKPK